VKRWLLGLSSGEATFARRGFHAGEPAARRRLEQVGATFLQGYHVALEDDALEHVALRLNAVEPELRGFAFEGAAMALALLDHLPPWRGTRWSAFARGPGEPHLYMVHVGAGWAWARLPWLRRHVERPLSTLDPVLGWLAIDGYGFHEGYFHWRRVVDEHAIPPRVTGYGRRAFDQGLGRSLWFVCGADVERIASAIGAFPSSRRSDLWSGVGLACSYAGGASLATVRELRRLAGEYRGELAQGAAFAAKARCRAGNPAAHTLTAVEVLCDRPSDLVVEVVDVALESLPPNGIEPAYEVWRQRIRARLAGAWLHEPTPPDEIAMVRGRTA
jgi:hypothetical protein